MAIKLLMRGGLGNQMFQYAAGRSLALRRGVPLVLDLRFYAQAPANSPKAFRLSDFPICSEIVDYQDKLLGPHHPIRRVYRKIFAERGNQIWREPLLTFDPEFFNLPDETTVAGEFNSPRYFEDVWDTIAPELDLAAVASSLPEYIDGRPLETFLAVHVRRGDYVGNSDFELIGAEKYYRRALKRARALGFSDILLFSDDLAYVRNLSFFEGARAYIGKPDDPPYLDLFAMSRCAGIIIANSTFSWWAGWLASRRGAPVFAPSHWVRSKTSRQMQILPESWTQVSCV